MWSAVRRTSFALWLAGLTCAAGAQTWVPVDNAPPGTPAQVLLDEAGSNEQVTTVEVIIHGYWSEALTGPDGNEYQRISIPGLTSTDRVGAPELPAVKVALAVTTDADLMQLEAVEVLGDRTWEQLVPAPLFTEGEDEDFDPTFDLGPGDTAGSDPEWAFDVDVYSSTDAWPVEQALDGFVTPQLAGVPGAAVWAYPVSFDPESKALTIQHHVKYTWVAAGQALEAQSIMKPTDRALGTYFLNWTSTNSAFPFDSFVYDARLLIIAKPEWFDTLAPFAFHKRGLGYETTIVTAQPFVALIRQTIADWYAEGDPSEEHYVLLCGDDDVIPLGFVQPSGEDVFSDDVYGTVGDINLSKEVHVGRLSVDDEDDLARQLDKIISYEKDPAPGDYGRVLLVAHKEDANGKYVGSHLKVVNEPYSNPPATIIQSFGSALVATNNTIHDVTEDGVGIVGYRGHGSTRAWTDWNFWQENWHANDVIGLANPMLPVVWHIACTNHNIAWEAGISDADSLGEVYMESEFGAVASYGATRTTSTTPNHFLNEWLFKAVFSFGLVNHAMATEVVELLVNINWPGHKNPWAYNLLGDPTMTIRTDEIVQILLSVAETIDLNQPLDAFAIEAVGEGGFDLVDGLVSLYKPSFFEGAQDELLGAWWLDGGGQAEVPLGDLIKTPGTLYVTVRDAHGNLSQVEVEVSGGTGWQDVGQSLAGELGAPRLAGVGTLVGGTPWELLLTNAQAFTTAWMCLGIDQLNAPFKGGVLVPNIAPPGFVLPLPTDAQGNIQLASAWPAGLPAGTQLVFQMWVQDASGPVGFTASNGLVATTP